MVMGVKKSRKASHGVCAQRADRRPSPLLDEAWRPQKLYKNRTLQHFHNGVWRCAVAAVAFHALEGGCRGGVRRGMFGAASQGGGPQCRAEG